MQKTLNREDVQKLFKLIDFDTDDEQSLEIFIDFANVVAAAERERIIATNAPEIEKVNVYIKALEDAVAVEREACAKVCDKLGDEFSDANAAHCADAIRARGQG